MRNFRETVFPFHWSPSLYYIQYRESLAEAEQMRKEESRKIRENVEKEREELQRKMLQEQDELQRRMDAVNLELR